MSKALPGPDTSSGADDSEHVSSSAVTKSAATTVLKQTQTIITFAYLVTVGVGMLYYHQKYSEFGINIFQYADIFYFLVAPFEDVFILQLCAIAVALFSFGYWIDHSAEHHFPRLYGIMSFGWDKKPWFNSYKVISWCATFIALLYLYSEIYGESSKEKILESEPVTVSFDDGQSTVGRMIGKTDDTLFLIDGDSVKAIPLNASVKEIAIASFEEPEPDEESSK